MQLSVFFTIALVAIFAAALPQPEEAHIRLQARKKLPGARPAFGNRVPAMFNHLNRRPIYPTSVPPLEERDFAPIQHQARRGIPASLRSRIKPIRKPARPRYPTFIPPPEERDLAHLQARMTRKITDIPGLRRVAPNRGWPSWLNRRPSYPKLTMPPEERDNGSF